MERHLVSSSNLVSVGYDYDTNILEIEFNSGTYRYFDVPEQIYDELMNSDSKGSYHHQNIKNSYSYEKI